MPTAIVLYGPKGVGKSRIARTLETRLAISHVDPDRIVLGLQAHGVGADPQEGWFAPIKEAMLGALQHHSMVSTEATGAYSTDWQLATELEGRGHRVLRVWITAPLDVARERLAARQEERVAVDPKEFLEIYERASLYAHRLEFDLEIETSGNYSGDDIVNQVQSLLERP